MEQVKTPTQAEVGSMSEILKFLMEERLKQDEEIAREWRRRDDKIAEERWKHAEMFSMLMKIMEESSRRWNSATTSSSYFGRHEEMKLTRLTEKDDIEAYLTTFERMMEVYGIGKEKWAYKLAPQLTGKAQQAYAAMQPEEAGDYEKLKSVVLRRYYINEETYCQRFRMSKR